MPILEQGTYFVYSVQPEDTLYSIANRFGSNVPAVSVINAVYPPFTDPGMIYPKDRLIIPYPYSPRAHVYYVVQPGDTIQSIAQSFSVSTQRLVEANPQLNNPDAIEEFELLEIPARIYAVNTGDSLNSISRQTGTPVQRIIQANQGRSSFSPDVMYPGYGLIIP
ncbi:LysM peptidoglycan-binding domain-containing protein [Salibacterium aidingense]|uniref:LysM peptidoglycan-binding domain-containing protein n=1 Tax=Salibacterium aidingense TaxID=384933 RepID=UPI003BE9A37D